MESEWVEMVVHSNGNHSQEYICAGKLFGNFLKIEQIMKRELVGEDI